MNQLNRACDYFGANRWNWPYWIVLAALLIVLPLFPDSNFIIHAMAMVMLFAYVGVAWDLLGGYAGQLSLGHSVYFGIGAYCSILFAVNFGLPPWVSMPIAGVLAAIASFLFFYPTFRFGLVGPYFALTTIGVAVIFELVAANLDITGGAQGLMVPFKPEGLYWLQSFDQRLYYYVGLVMLAVIMVISVWIRRSKLGYQLVAVREDEAAAEACGINVGLRKIQITAISAALTAVGGVLYVQSISYVGPGIFSVTMAVSIALAPILGGSGWLLGPLVGAALLTAINTSIELFVGTAVPGLNIFVYGMLLIVVVLAMPSGIVPAFVRLAGTLNRGIRRSGFHMSTKGRNPGAEK